MSIPRIWLATAWLLLCGSLSAAVATLTFDSGQSAKAAITSLSWDTEAAALPGRTANNLLGRGSAAGYAYIDATFGTTTLRGRDIAAYSHSASSTTFSANGLNFTLTGTTQSGAISLAVSVSGSAGYSSLTAMDLTFEFNPLITPTTVIPSVWNDSSGIETYFSLPAIISAPDYGQMLFTSTTTNALKGYLRGIHPIAGGDGSVVITIQIPPPIGPTTFNFSLNPSYLTAPQDVDGASWLKARRGWYGTWQPNANWIGDQSYFLQPRAGILAAPPDAGNQTQAAFTNYNVVGMLGNNVVSDIGSGSLWFYADQAYFTPQLAPGISIASTVKRSLEWWLDNRTFKTASFDLGPHFPVLSKQNYPNDVTRDIPSIDGAGQVLYYWYYSDFLDPEAALIIAAWDYVDSTGDVAWLNAPGGAYWGATTRLEQLEIVAGYLAGRINASKLVAAKQDGLGTRKKYDRGCSWWDAFGNGNEDAFLNALSYRAFRCLADLEFKKGNRNAKILEFTTYADRLKDNYEARLLDTNPNTPTIPKSPTIDWWRDTSGTRHGFHSPPINGLAIEYGLTSDANARSILNGVSGPNTGLWYQISQVNFPPSPSPFPSPLGLPSNIYDWTAAEYPIFGAGTFQTYQNGTVFAGHSLHPIVADQLVNGGSGNGNAIFQAMLTAEATSTTPAFQNGTQYHTGSGADFKKWNGDPTGYEGFLAEDFSFLQALPLSTPYWRTRFYRPLHPMKTQNDFNYNLCGDIVWRNPSTGDNTVWLMNGPTVTSSLTLPNVPGGNTWVIEGNGDFNRDRLSDLLWRDTSGNTVIWYIDPTIPTGKVNSEWIAQQIDPSFLIRGITDFGNDDKADILQHNPTSGAVRIWHMDGAIRIQEQLLPLTRTSPWTLAGTGDLDGDGRPDLVWHNGSTGANEVWFQSYGAYPTAQSLTANTSAWVVAGINDFDGDGKADLLWRNTATGDNQLWLMNGSMVTSYINLPSVPANDWNIVGVSDFDGDRRADILWRDTSGNNVIWFMNGGTLLYYQWIQALASTWVAKLPQN